MLNKYLILCSSTELGSKTVKKTAGFALGCHILFLSHQGYTYNAYTRVIHYSLNFPLTPVCASDFHPFSETNDLATAIRASEILYQYHVKCWTAFEMESDLSAGTNALPKQDIFHDGTKFWNSLSIGLAHLLSPWLTFRYQKVYHVFISLPSKGTKLLIDMPLSINNII